MAAVTAARRIPNPILALVRLGVKDEILVPFVTMRASLEIFREFVWLIWSAEALLVSASGPRMECGRRPIESWA